MKPTIYTDPPIETAIKSFFINPKLNHAKKAPRPDPAMSAPRFLPVAGCVRRGSLFGSS